MKRWKITYQVRNPRPIPEVIMIAWDRETFYTQADTPAEANRNLEYNTPYPARIWLHSIKTEEIPDGCV